MQQQLNASQQISGNMFRTTKPKQEASLLRDNAKNRVAILAQMGGDNSNLMASQQFSKKSDKDSLSGTISHAKINDVGGTPSNPEKVDDLTKQISQLKQEERSRKKALWRLQLMWFIEHPATQIVMTIITVYSLFFDDIRIIAFPKSADSVFFGLTLFSFIAYCLEIILASIAIDGYFNSFFFWLDVVSTVTMLPDCGWIWYPIMQQGSALLATGKTADIAKTTRSSRVTRIIRIIRLMRLFRIVKLYKQVKAAERQRLQAINEQRSETRILRKKNNVLAQHMVKLQNKVTPIIDQGGGTGGVIERQESVDSLDREMQEIDQSMSQPRIVSASLEQSNISHVREASQSI